jgi:hypothetical protein
MQNGGAWHSEPSSLRAVEVEEETERVTGFTVLLHILKHLAVSPPLCFFYIP